MSEADRQMLANNDSDFWYSDFIKEHSSSFILQDSGIYNLNTTGVGLSMLPILNEDGIYKVNGKIYQHKMNLIKIIEDGDSEKIKLLDNIKSSNSELDILVFNDVESDNQLDENLKLSYNHILSSGGYVCEDQNGKDRVTGEIRVTQAPTGTNYDYHTYIFVGAENWYNNGIFGGYTRKRTSFLKIRGTINAYSYDVANYAQPEIINVNINTGGNLKTRIGGNIWYGPIRNYSYSAGTSGTLVIEGRNRTKCGDASNDDPSWVYRN
jgi:hypothetical protein